MKKLKILLMNIAKKNLIFRKVSRNILFVYRRLRYIIRGIGKKTDDKMIIFCTFNGKSYADSPKAIYEFMINNDKYKKYKFVWMFKDLYKYKELENNENTILVEKGTRKAEQYLARAKYWVLNYKIQEHIYPKKDQIFIQCWHGTPLKRLGYDLVHFDNSLNTMTEMKKRYKIETQKIKYFLSPSKFATEKFVSAWNLKEFGKENIILEKGYPRNDFLINYTKEDVENVKKKFDIKNEGKKIILYAPTYRGNQHTSGVGYTYKVQVDFDKLKNELENDYIILFRAHYYVSNQFDFDKYKGFVYNVSEVDDINELYIISDILVTDYSSVFFDYANLKKPIIFHMYDLEQYRDESNGFYIDINKELPGKITKTETELIEEIKDITKNFKYNEKYKQFNSKYNYLDDGQASKRVIDEVIHDD